MRERDPLRCEVCRCFWQPEARQRGLVLRMGRIACRDVQACYRRTALAESLDRLIGRAA